MNIQGIHMYIEESLEYHKEIVEFISENRKQSVVDMMILVL